MDPTQLNERLERLAAERPELRPDFNEGVWREIQARSTVLSSPVGPTEWAANTVANPLVILASVAVAIIVGVTASLGMEHHRHRQQSDLLQAFGEEAPLLPSHFLEH